jgi:hypothetical protein
MNRIAKLATAIVNHFQVGTLVIAAALILLNATACAPLHYAFSK